VGQFWFNKGSLNQHAALAKPEVVLMPHEPPWG